MQARRLGVMPTSMSPPTSTASTAHNVIGKIGGPQKGQRRVLYMGHWDHLGICAPEDAPDRICNGAVDNASGIAVLTEVAERLAKKRHDRDIYFIATTAEESGLLGAYAYADKPVFPLDQIVMSLNVDTIAIAPRGAKVAIIGRGTTSKTGCGGRGGSPKKAGARHRKLRPMRMPLSSGRTAGR